MSAENVERIAEILLDGFAAIHTETALEVTHALVVATPVLTGWARANWVPAIGTAWLGLVGEPPGLAGGAASHTKRARGKIKRKGDAVRENASAGILGYRLGMGSIFVSNNVPYLTGPGSLDEGHSKQAARGWIRQAIEDAVNLVYQRHGGLEKVVST